MSVAARLGWLAAALCAGTSWLLLQEPRSLVASGIGAYRAGDFATAQARFEEAVAVDPSRTSQRNLALAALAAGDVPGARQALEALASRGAEQDLAWRAFLYGNLAWQQSRAAEFEAHGPIPPAGALERAIAFAEQAQEGWEEALERRPGWGEAERNLGRVAERLAALREEAALGGEGPEREKMPTPEIPELAPEQQLLLMEQLDRLDLQEVERRAEQRPEPEGGWDW